MGEQGRGKSGRRVLPLLLAGVFIAGVAVGQDAGGCESEGGLLLKTDRPDVFLPAPAVSTQARLSVHGVIARAEVRQVFSNPTDWWVEGIYLFPLPETAAVDHLEMWIGDRRVVGEIRERAEARREYEAARSEGRRASLVSQERPNLFTTEVANIGPGESVEVVIHYQQTVRRDGREFSLRFPTTLTPRFDPDGGCGDPWAEAGGQAAAPSAPPSFDLELELDVGLPLAEYRSSLEVEVERLGATRYAVRLPGEVPADRDFELLWVPEVGPLPQAAAFVEHHGGETYLLLTLMPPAAESEVDLRLPRETVFVVDTSGSMHGASLGQAKQALRYALSRLKPEDSFNIIQFNSTTQRLFEASLPVGRYSLLEAERYVDTLEADGGTMIQPALAAALDDRGGRQPVRQVVFLTDGAVANEPELMDYVAANLGESRLFTVGIGSAPNTYFMRKVAQFGRGTFTYIGSEQTVAEEMTRLLEKLESPVLADLEVGWEDPLVEVFPRRLPDLYLGEPLTVVARLTDPGASIRLGGRRGAVPWERELTLPPPTPESGIARLWARQRIEALMDDLHTGGDAEQLRTEIVELALEHHLVSRFTSLVAVELTPSAPVEARPPTRPVPLATPAGWTAPGLVTSLPATASRAPLLLAIGLLALAAAALLGRRAAA